MPNLANDALLGIGLVFDEKPVDDFFAAFEQRVEKFVNSVGIQFTKSSEAIIKSDSKVAESRKKNLDESSKAYDEFFKKRKEQLEAWADYDSQKAKEGTALTSAELKKREEINAAFTAREKKLEADRQKAKATWESEQTKLLQSELSQRDKAATSARQRELAELKKDILARNKEREKEAAKPVPGATPALEEITKKRLALEEAAHSLSFKRLEKQYQDHARRVVDLSGQLYEQRINHASKAEIAITANLLHEEKERTAVLRREYTSRDEVKRKGAGAFMGILGTGRNLISASGLTAGSVLAGGTIMAGIGLEAKKGVELAAAFELAMAHLGNEAGIEGSVVDKLGEKIRKTAVQFNTELPDAITATETALRSLGPEFRNDASAMDSALASILTLSKAQKITATESTEVLTTTLHQFGLDTGSATNQAAAMGRIMNVLAAATKEGVANLPQLAQGLKDSGIQAHSMGISVEQDAAAIEVLSKKGIGGAEAGGKFALFLSKIAGSTPEVEKGLKRIGLTFSDINPEKVGLINSLRILSEHLNKVGNPVNRMEVLTEVFGMGARGAVKIAEAVLSDVDALQKVTDKITGTTSAQDQANKVMQTSSELYKHAKEEQAELALSLGQKLLPMLNSLELVALGAFDELRKLFSPESYHIEEVSNLIEKTRKQTTDLAISLVNGKFFNKDIARNNLVDFASRSLSNNNPLSLTMEQQAQIVEEASAILNKAIADKTAKSKPSKDNTFGGSSKPLKQQFEERRQQIEDDMRQEITDSELHGLELNKTKEQIEIDSLNIEIRYQKKIADAAEQFSQYSGEFYLKSAKDRVRIREIGLEEERKLLEARDKSFEIDYKFQLDSADQFEKKRLQLLHDFDKAAEGLTSEQSIKINAQLTQDLQDNEDAKNDARLKKETEFQAKMLSVEMKGIEQQVKTHKDNTHIEIQLEEERYNKALDQQKNYYAKAILEAKADEKLLEIAKQENNIAERNLLIEHLETLKKITEEAHRDIKNIFENALTSEIGNAAQQAFQPWQDEITKTKDFFGGLLLSVAKGFATLGAQRLSKGIFDSLFGDNKKVDEGSNIADQTVAHSAIPAPLPHIALPENTPGGDNKKEYADSSFANATFETVTVENLTVGGSLIGSDNSSLIGGGLSKVQQDILNQNKTNNGEGTYVLDPGNQSGLGDRGLLKALRKIAKEEKDEEYLKTSKKRKEELGIETGGAFPNPALTMSQLKRGDGTSTNFRQPFTEGSLTMSPKRVKEIEEQTRRVEHYEKMQGFMDRDDVAKGLSKGWDLDSSVGGAHPEFINLAGILGKGFGTSTLDEWRNIRQDKDPNSERWSMNDAIGKGFGNPETLAAMMPDHWLLEPTIKELSYSLNKKNIPEEETPGLLSLINSAPSLLTTDASVNGTTDDSKKDKQAEKTGLTIGKTLIDFTNSQKKGANPASSALGAAGSLISLLPGGSLIGGLLGILPSFLSTGKDPEYAANGLVNWRPKGGDTMPAMIDPRERVLSVKQNEAYERTMDSMRRITDNYDLHTAARSSSYSGGSQSTLSPEHVQQLIQSNHAIGEAIDAIDWKVSNDAIRGASNRKYADTVRKKFY